jgi:predicted TPR repeat methyltransferase
MSNHEQARQLFLRGLTHFEAQQLEDACNAFEAARVLVPERPSVLQNLGITLSLLGRDEEAIAMLQKAAALEPEHGSCWLHLGLSLQRCTRWPEAAQAFERALALQPDDYALHLTHASCLVRAGQPALALSVHEQAIRLQPEKPAAWTEKGHLLRELGRLTEAAKSYTEALRLGADPALNQYYLAAVSNTASPPPAPRGYVEALFDEYAAEFQSHLVEQLGYCAHRVLCQPLTAAGQHHVEVLDLGCGTGLCAQLLQQHSDAVDGVDISSAMVAQARALGIYRQLAHADLSDYLQIATQRYDLILAADVFIYVGELDGIFARLRHLLKPQGIFAFSLERAHGDGLELLPSLRYAHSEAYLRALADKHDFRIRELIAAPLRYDQQTPVAGLYAYLSLI